jgi:hypothetical protein
MGPVIVTPRPYASLKTNVPAVVNVPDLRYIDTGESGETYDVEILSQMASV